MVYDGALPGSPLYGQHRPLTCIGPVVTQRIKCVIYGESTWPCVQARKSKIVFERFIKLTKTKENTKKQTAFQIRKTAQGWEIWQVSEILLMRKFMWSEAYGKRSSHFINRSSYCNFQSSIRLQLHKNEKYCTMKLLSIDLVQIWFNR